MIDCEQMDRIPHGDYAKSILLPFDQVFRNLRNAKRFAVDIGGSLVKLAYCSTVFKKTTLVTPPTANGLNRLYGVSEANVEGIRLHFIKFETKYMESCMDFIREKMSVGGQDGGNSNGSSNVSKVIKATGGGAHKYYDLISEKLKLTVGKEDEIECLIKGCNFLLRNIPDESFSYHHHEPNPYKFQNIDSCHIFPYLLVNIGSGVSVIKVESDRDYERVGGTSLGGGTFWGMGSLMSSSSKSFDDLLALAEEGDHRHVDMLVRDIYGGAYQKLGLDGDVIASSFGKTVRSHKDGDSSNNKPDYQERDLVRSLLLMISNCIGQIAYLYAKNANLKRIYFGGYFIRGHPFTMRTISYAINYWSGGEIQAMFLRHEGYLGAIGAFLKGAEEDALKLHNIDAANFYTWSEHYAGSTGLLLKPKNPVARAKNPQQSQNSNSNLIQLLEMDCSQKNLTSCPLLADATHYNPDTVDLTQDGEARDYWLECFEQGVDKTIKKALESQPNSADAKERAANFKHRYVQCLRTLKAQPFTYGFLNVRSLLDLNEQLLNEYYFPDAYSIQKHAENEHALKLFEKQIAKIDILPFRERQLALVKSLLAGNVFDWGAQEVVNLLEAKDGLSFEDALSKLQDRPWMFDGFDDWFERLEKDKPHSCACIFVDNSGFDLILGVFPFARELLKRGTKARVILCANSRPALNDVTFNELDAVTGRIATMCPIIKDSLANESLFVAESGQGSPCLDLSRLDAKLCRLIEQTNVDLLILEGMGRAIHTNFEAKFVCETIKAAALKNQWLANRLGGPMFGVVFKYEKAIDQKMLKAVVRLIKKPILSSYVRNFAASGPGAKIVPPTLNEDESFVDMDSEKLVNYCCVNYLVNSEPIEIKSDDQYPSWIWELRLGDPPTLDELDPNFYPYWQKLEQIYEEQLKRRQSTRYASAIVQRKNLQSGDKEFFQQDWERKKQLH
uniref:4'-phosphopantetheine phosphatase n=1 Tax=Romanomermis culicivorax TaxID=13658 RepID=A0A915ITW2_ROMCU